MSERTLSRDEQKARKALEKAFGDTLKQEAKALGWSYLKPTPFKRIDDWFVSLMPNVLTDAFRAELGCHIKPFAIDDLLHEILGHGALPDAPLSLRARGPHCVVGPMFTTSIESGGDLDTMIRTASDFMRTVPRRVSQLHLHDFVRFERDNTSPNHTNANLVAGLLLAGQCQEALDLCHRGIASQDLGGLAVLSTDGSMASFPELAARWIQNRVST